MDDDKRPKSIVDQITEVCEEFCNNYCKYPVLYDPEEHDDIDLCDSGICDSCPVGKLV